MVINNYKGQYDYDFFNNMIDKYKFQIPYKKEFTPNPCYTIYITSKHQMKDWYPFVADISEMVRRFYEIVYMDDKGKVKHNVKNHPFIIIILVLLIPI